VHRRAVVPPGLLLLAALVVAAATLLSAGRPAAAQAAGVVPHAATMAVERSPDDPDRPPVTANDFLPEERNLSDCVGALERPGCGSEARGGWRQTLVFLVVAAGLALVFGRIAWSARRSRQRA
jgi:hypothetical protein